MKIFLRLLFSYMLFFSIVMPEMSSASGYKVLSFKGNIPNCSALRLGRIANILSDDFRGSKKSELFCDDADIASDSRSPLVDIVRSVTGELDEMDNVFFLITDKKFSDTVCSKLSTSYRRFAAIADVSSGKNWIKDLNNCLPKSEFGHKITDFFIKSEDFKSFHPKYITFSYLNSDDSGIVLSSGNPTRTSFNNIDYYLYLSVSKKSIIYLWHECVTNILVNSRSKVDYKNLEQYYNLCKLKQNVLSDSKISSYLLPFDRTEVIYKIAFLAGISKKIHVVSQGYGSPEILDILESAASQGVEVKIIRDDDLLLTASDLRSNLTSDFSEYFAWDREICKYGADVRFLLTNYQNNYLHSKFIVFSGDFGEVVFFGSANLTYSAFNDNIENVYFAKDLAVSDRFKSFFDVLWGDYSMKQSEIEDVYSKIGPTKSARRFPYHVCN